MLIDKRFGFVHHSAMIPLVDLIFQTELSNHFGFEPTIALRAGNGADLVSVDADENTASASRLDRCELPDTSYENIVVLLGNVGFEIFLYVKEILILRIILQQFLDLLQLLLKLRVFGEGFISIQIYGALLHTFDFAVVVEDERLVAKE